MEQRLTVGALRQAARRGTDPAGEQYLYLTVQDTVGLARQLGLSRREVELAALKEEIIPNRYQRSIGTVGIRGQIQLLQSRVAIVGAGGLGGGVIELLARMGVGEMVVVDDDCFDDSNLNRQLLATESSLRAGKAEAAARRVAEINGAVAVTPCRQRGDAESLPELLEGCRLALDCLDNLSSRFALEECCRQAGIPLVHGAIAGFMGQLAVIHPDRPLFASIYGTLAGDNGDKGVETSLGNPATTPAMLAAWQANEAVKILAGLQGVLRDKLLIIDMLSGETTAIKIEESGARGRESE